MNTKRTSMLHLSLLRLPLADPRWRHLDPYQAHQVVWKAFPDVPRGERPFLFSLDARPTHQSLLVQSARAPTWEQFDGGAEVEQKTFDPMAVPAGVPLRFFLRANPTVERKGYASGSQRIGVGLNPALTFERMGRPGEHPTRPEDVAVWRHGELVSWLERQGERGGFRLDVVDGKAACLTGPIVARKLIRGAKDRRPPMTLHEVEFTGRLIVTDREAFARTAARGVGRGKAFGCGLLMVRPA